MSANQSFLAFQSFFKDNPKKVLGEITIKKRGDRGEGKTEEIIKGTIADISKIEAPTFKKYVPTKTKEKVVEKEVKVIVEKAPEKTNRDKAFENNEKSIAKAKTTEVSKDGIDTIKESFYKYNEYVSKDELDAWLITHPMDLLHSAFKPSKSIEELVEKGLIFYHLENGQKELIYRYDYLAGDLYKRIKSIDRNRDSYESKFGKTQTDFQLEQLRNALPMRKSVRRIKEEESIIIEPYSELVDKFEILEGFTKSYPNDTGMSLREAFAKYIRSIASSKILIPSVVKDDISKIIWKKSISLSKVEKEDLDDKDEEKTFLEKKKQNAKSETLRLFREFLREELSSFAQQDFDNRWNEQNNGLVTTYRFGGEDRELVEKIPVAFPFSKTFKRGSQLLLSTVQRNGVAFFKQQKSVLLGYDVGVGKTLTSIACISEAFASGRAKRCLLSVPDATYKKWVFEIAGGVDADGNWIQGATPHIPVVQLGNLGAEIVEKQLMTYSATTKEKIKVLKGFATFLRSQLNEIRNNDDKVASVLLSIQKELDKDYNASIKSEPIFEVNNTRLADVQDNPLLFRVELNEWIRVTSILKNQEIYQNGELKELPESCILLVNFDGQKQLGIQGEDYTTLSKDLYRILSQGESLSTARKRQTSSDIAKKSATLLQKIDETVSIAFNKANFDISDFGIDMFCVDEAHNMRNVFKGVAGSLETSADSGNDEQDVTKDGYVKRETSQYSMGSSEPTTLAINGLMISLYVQRKTNWKNVLMLTATPFTNSPLEIYAMICLTNYNFLVRNHKESLHEFFTTFIKENSEVTVTATGGVKVQSVFTGFKHLAELKQLIFSIIDYRTGEDANVIRPTAINIPDNTKEKKWGGALSYLELNALQKTYMEDVLAYVERRRNIDEICDYHNLAGISAILPTQYLDRLSTQMADKYRKHRITPEKEKESFRILRAISFQKSIALSPYLYPCNELGEPTYEEFVENSPKIHYAVQCIESVKKWHEERNEQVSGQVIYMADGVQFHQLIKEYLVKKVGFKEHEIALINSKGSNAKNKNERSKELFLKGKVKVVIGTQTIREGVDLQNKSTSLYNLTPDWNPTDYNQLKGRIWRQGNENTHVRIVTALMSDSIDVFIYQKLQEKMIRFSKLLDRKDKTNTLDFNDVNPSEIKEALITDPYKKALIRFQIYETKLREELLIKGSLLNQSKKWVNIYQAMTKSLPQYIEVVNRFNKVWQKYKVRQERIDFEEKKKAILDSGNEFNKKFSEDAIKEKFPIKIYEVDVFDFDTINAVNLRATRVVEMCNKWVRSGNNWEYELAKEVLGKIPNTATYSQSVSFIRQNRLDYFEVVTRLQEENIKIDDIQILVDRYQKEYDSIGEKLLPDNAKNRVDNLVEIIKTEQQNSKSLNRSVEDRVREFASLNKYLEGKVIIPKSLVQEVSNKEKKKQILVSVSKMAIQYVKAKTKDEKKKILMGASKLALNYSQLN